MAAAPPRMGRRTKVAGAGAGLPGRTIPPARKPKICHWRRPLFGTGLVQRRHNRAGDRSRLLGAVNPWSVSSFRRFAAGSTSSGSSAPWLRDLRPARTVLADGLRQCHRPCEPLRGDRRVAGSPPVRHGLEAGLVVREARRGLGLGKEDRGIGSRPYRHFGGRGERLTALGFRRLRRCRLAALSRYCWTRSTSGMMTGGCANSMPSSPITGPR